MAYAGDISDVVIDVWTIWKGNLEEAKKAKATLIQDITKVCDDVQKDGNLTQGTHANGFISWDVANAAGAATTKLDAQFPRGTNSDPGRLADALRVVFTKLAALPTDGHDPWLIASWQISFEFIAQGAAEGFGYQA